MEKELDREETIENALHNLKTARKFMRDGNRQGAATLFELVEEQLETVVRTAW